MSPAPTLPLRQRLPRTQVLAWLACGAAGLLAFAWLRAFTPSGISTCLSATLLGIDCPGCGMTRAVSLLGHGDIIGSFALHPLAIPFAVQVVVAWSWWGLVLARRARVPSPWWGIGVLTLDMAALVVTWILRLVTGTLPT